ATRRSRTGDLLITNGRPATFTGRHGRLRAGKCSGSGGTDDSRRGTSSYRHGDWLVTDRWWGRGADLLIAHQWVGPSTHRQLHQAPVRPLRPDLLIWDKWTVAKDPR